ncbi:hypothetical protein HZA85_03565 [Candidatus Uhrbacteria bacterium]|nr:hypothetical protein [Candidatus Uhrbacteria bacterium]
MIAEVYPLRRLSRAIPFFDYEIPTDLVLKRGDFVWIPLRQREVLGVVKRVKPSRPRGLRLKQIACVSSVAALREEELSFFESVAISLAQPVANLLFTSLPQPSKKTSVFVAPVYNSSPLTIPSKEAPTVARLASALCERRESFVQVPDLRRAACVIACALGQKPSGKYLLMCPHVIDARRLADALSVFSPLCVTGEESASKRFGLWEAYRCADQALLITTRTGVFWADAKTDGLFVVRSSHPDHVQHDRNPRLDSRRIAQTFARAFTASLTFFDVCPRVEDLACFAQEAIFSYSISSEVRIIDITRERPVSGDVTLMPSVVTAIEETIQKGQRVLLVFNRKGFAARWRCQDCGNTIDCPLCGGAASAGEHTLVCARCLRTQAVPLACPTCHSPQVRARGYGNERLAQTLQRLFPNQSLCIVDSEHPESSKAQITLATQYDIENHFDPFHPDPLGLVVHLNPDAPLFSPDFRSSQRALWSVYEWLGVAHASGAAYWLSSEEQEFFASALNDPLPVLQAELAFRKHYGQPPFSVWAMVTFKESEKHKREQEVHMLKQSLEAIETTKVSALSSDSVDQARLRVSLSSERVPELLAIFTGLDDRYIIDMNAFS